MTPVMNWKLRLTWCKFTEVLSVTLHLTILWVQSASIVWSPHRNTKIIIFVLCGMLRLALKIDAHTCRSILPTRWQSFGKYEPKWLVLTSILLTDISAPDPLAVISDDDITLGPGDAVSDAPVWFGDAWPVVPGSSLSSSLYRQKQQQPMNIFCYSIII